MEQVVVIAEAGLVQCKEIARALKRKGVETRVLKPSSGCITGA